jgi:phosphoglycolate phosphatase
LPSPSHILFDLDGTLIDSKRGIFASYRTMLRGLGHEPDPAVDLNFVLGPPLQDVIAEVLAHYGDTRIADGMAAYRQSYAETGMFNCTAYDGIPELLERLTSRGLQLYLATSKRRVFAESILGRIGLARYFRTIYGAEPDGSIDHKPELIAHILSRDNIPPAKAVMIGDRRFDIAGAQANHVSTIGVLWGYGTRDELDQAGADRLVSSPGELDVLLRGTGG